MSTPRSGVSAIVLEDHVYILGGFNGSSRLRTVECFTINMATSRFIWKAVPTMHKARSNFTCSIMNGKLYVSGGYTDPTVSACCEVYCPLENRWTELPNMMMAKSALRQITVSYANTQSIKHLLNA